ncbi:MAG: hypothetical protein BWX81_00999 [Spirochaetes bacterium ADurb.Bin110]|nr:MAG: hypothetical protein BWX81_00999 [Spirochaetes bacterium ADurb.Bin110]
MYKVSDLKIAIVPSVTMKGAILPFVIRKPLRKPALRAMASETINADRMLKKVPSHIGEKPTRALVIIFNIRIAPAPASAVIEPTERSIPPDMITKVIPSAMIPV